MACSRAIYNKYTSQLVWNHICDVHKIAFEVPVKNILPPIGMGEMRGQVRREEAKERKGGRWRTSQKRRRIILTRSLHPLKHVCSPKLKVAGHWRFNFWEGGDPCKALDHSGNFSIFTCLFLIFPYLILSIFTPSSGNKFHVKMVGGARYADDGVGMFIPPRTNNAPLPTCVCTSPPSLFSFLLMFLSFFLHIFLFFLVDRTQSEDLRHQFKVHSGSHHSSKHESDKTRSGLPYRLQTQSLMWYSLPSPPLALLLSVLSFLTPCSINLLRLLNTILQFSLLSSILPCPPIPTSYFS